MPGPRRQSVILTDTQRASLERLARRQTSPQAIARRARILLLAAEAKQNEPIARELGCHREQVRAWRKRWAEAALRLLALEESLEASAQESASRERVRLEALAEVLADRPRSGRPPEFTAEQVCQILTLACEEPVDSGREATHWTPGEVAEEAARRGIVRSISARSVRRFFARPPSDRTASATG